MKKKYDIQLKALLLLLLYVFCNSPAILFHHHKLDKDSCKKATFCKKTIYYSVQDGNCTHKTHISTATEKCWFCDNHTISAHSFQTFLTEYFSKEFSGYYLQVSENYYFEVPSTLSNRGPPSVSSITV